MNVLKAVLISILTLSAVVFCALFGSLPRFRKTPIGYINRFIWIQLPTSFLAIDAAISGGRFSSWLRRTGSWLMHENHPVVLIFYLSLLVGGELTFVPAVWSRLSQLQTLLLVIVIALPYVFTYLTVTTQSSVITPANHAEELQRYPYDYALFFPGQFCRTCQHVKPPRSKHCRVCNVCVAKQDHHCLWVKTCLGRGNYHYFLAMCGALGMMLSYGAYLAHQMMSLFLQARFDAQNPGSSIPWTTGLAFWDRMNALGWAFAWDVRVGAVGLLAAFTAPLAWGLFLYHIYLIWVGVTTNESFKWDDWKADIRDGYVYKAQVTRKVQESFEVPRVRWPKPNTQKLLNRADELSIEYAGHIPDLSEPHWTQVRSTSEVNNLYDLGFWENVKDCFPKTAKSPKPAPHCSKLPGLPYEILHMIFQEVSASMFIAHDHEHWKATNSAGLTRTCSILYKISLEMWQHYWHAMPQNSRPELNGRFACPRESPEAQSRLAFYLQLPSFIKLPEEIRMPRPNVVRYLNLVLGDELGGGWPRRRPF